MNKRRGVCLRWLSFNYRPEYRHGILSGLRQIGEEVLIAPLRSQGERQVHRMRQVIASYRPHLVFTAGWAHDVVDPPLMFEVLRTFGIPHIYWATEDPTFHREVSLQFAPYSQLVLTTAQEMLLSYESMGITAGVMLFGCNPLFHRPYPVDTWLQRQVVLVANNYLAFGHHHPTREETTRRMLLPLLDTDLDLLIWGLWWDDKQSPFTIAEHYLAGPLAYRHLPRVYSAAHITLGIQFDDTSPTQTSCRPFEALSCGAFHLAPYTEATAALFTHGEHLVLSHKEEQTLELARYYLDHPQQRARIAQSGRRYVVRHHNYRERARQLMAMVRAAGVK